MKNEISEGAKLLQQNMCKKNCAKFLLCYFYLQHTIVSMYAVYWSKCQHVRRTSLHIVPIYMCVLVKYNY